jgi:Protein of unknown function (DUF1559)
MAELSDKTGKLAQPRPRSWGQAVAQRVLEVCVVLLILDGLFLLIWPSFNTHILQAVDRIKASDRLKHIGVAIHNYDHVNGELPTNTFGPDGTPLLSWRVHILPYLDHGDLYAKFKLDEPWNSPHNIAILDQMPDEYRYPRQADELRNKTCYRGFSNRGAVFERRPPRNLAMPLLGGPVADMKTRFSLANLKDPLAQTFLVVEATELVEWTKPDDLDAAPDKPFPTLGGARRQAEYFGAIMCDGSLRVLPVTTDETKLRALVSHSGGEKVDP